MFQNIIESEINYTLNYEGLILITEMFVVVGFRYSCPLSCVKEPTGLQ
jgi:hypothetical protein